MAKIIDPDSLNQSTQPSTGTEDGEVYINTATKTIELIVFGNLDDNSPGKDSGVTGKALYSFLKEEWKTDNNLNKFKFPIQMIYEAQFIWINGWSPENQQTRDLIRDAGFQEGTTGRENACIISLGTMEATGETNQAYYVQDFTSEFAETTSTFDKTDELNENVLIDDGAGDVRTSYLKVFLRQQAKLYSSYSLLAEQGLPSLTYQAYRLPLANAVDTAVTETDANIDTILPYTGMKINYLKGIGFTTFADATVYPAESVVLDGATGRWFFTALGGTSNNTTVATDTGVTDWAAYDGERDIGGTYYAFNRIIDGGTDAGRTTVKIYEWAMRQLRKTGDINAADSTTVNQRYGTVNGNLATDLVFFVGDQLNTRGGVFIDNYLPAEVNDYAFGDITVDGDTDGEAAPANGLDSEYVPQTSTPRIFPFVSTGNINFNAALTDEVDNTTRYTMYYQYLTRVSGSYTLTLSAGATGDLTWASTDLDHISATDYIYLTGFSTTPEMDGLYLVNTVGANTMNITHQGGTTLVTETATIQVDENPFESLGAVIVENSTPANIDGEVSASQIAFNYDYDNNTQRGTAANGSGNGTSPEVIIASLAYDGAQYITVTHTITRTSGQTINVFPADELNYDNPA